MERLLCLYAVALCIGLFVKVSDGAAADVSSCPDALTKLLPCLPFSQGTAQVPTKDCCTNLETIHETKPQCLCALIAASVNGTAGLPKMNTTLSLMLGPACNVATKPAVCPELLGLSPDDPLNKIFTNGSAATNTTTTPVSQGPTASGASTGPSAPPPDNNAPSLSFSLSASFVLSGMVFAFL
ncbi:hypothetical protein GOP47_0001581 [Adiantum capillus-veneris]|uniref:Bifunctional inhibitor/plant lipid transfer protein/seed storage helical domain-containing protein n=1 Tax=Adiantum capillus-veneris TaxID=13818 RepID=A0A9D4V8Z3_ADICA|nr:hypothetical protein GOP47_0001581 [Adiantum capillus-veneris]